MKNSRQIAHLLYRASRYFAPVAVFPHPLAILMISLLILIRAPQAFSSPTPVSSQACLAQKQVDSMLSSFLWTRVHPVTKRVTAMPRFDRCDSSQLQYKVIKALLDLENLPHLTTIPENAKWSTEPPIQYIRNRVNGFQFDLSTAPKCASSTAIAYLEPLDDSVHVCPRLALQSEYSVMNILIHETRHVDGHRHVICSHGAFTGSYSCDSSYEQQGSYGFATAFNLSVSRETSLPLAIRQEARVMAVSDLMERFNELPFGLRNGVLLQDSNGSLEFFDGKNGTETLIDDLYPQAILTERNGFPTLYDPPAGEVKSYMYQTNLIDTSGEYANDFRRRFQASKRRALLDVFYGSPFSCLLFEEEASCSDGSGAKSSIRILFKKSAPRRFVRIDNRLGVILDNNSIALLPQTSAELSSMREEHLESLPNPYGYISYVGPIGGHYFGLSQEGVLLKTTAWKDRPIVVPELAHRRFKKVIGPLLWSKKLEEL